MKVAIILDRDLPHIASDYYEKENGFSLYRGVMVCWGKFHDERVFGIIDQMPTNVKDGLLVVQFNKGSIAFVWDGDPPPEYAEGSSVAPSGGDCWNIISSVALERRHAIGCREREA